MSVYDKIKISDEKLKIIFDPVKYGYPLCDNCNGYGSLTRSLDAIHELCPVCDGNGYLPKEEEDE